MLHAQLYFQPQLYLTDNTVSVISTVHSTSTCTSQRHSITKTDRRERSWACQLKSSCKVICYFSAVLTKIGYRQPILVKIPNVKFHENRFRVIEMTQADGWTDGRTDMANLTIAVHLLMHRKLWLRMTKLKKWGSFGSRPGLLIKQIDAPLQGSLSNYCPWQCSAINSRDKSSVFFICV